jgi:hypothetical protein
MRIADKTAAGGISILIMNVGDGLTDAQKQGFVAATMELHDDPKIHSRFCAQVAAIGPPSYIPVYLVSHGLGDAVGSDPQFDPGKAWSLLLRDGLLCSPR